MLKRIVKKSRYAKKRVKMIGGGYHLTATDKKALRDYWKPYGVRPKEYWYRLYCARKNTFDPRYIPDSMWYGQIYPYFNNLLARNSYGDKGFFDTLFQDLKRPETVVKNMGGHFYDGNMRLMTREEAIQKCAELDHWVIKSSTNTGSGRGVQFFDSTGENNGEKVRDLFDAFHVNFIVQKLVEQHPDLAKIHHNSLNTVRVQSFFFRDEVHILSAQLRMGGGASRVDNISSGGYSCPIMENGRLQERAVNRKSEWIEQHESGIYFRDIQVPSYDKIIETVKRKHKQLPYFGIIGWDFAVDREGDPVFIEFNVTSEPNQIASGPTFGDLTEQVLKDVFIEKPMKDFFLS
ncbi:MAG: sugar-transfer associated ATP-grasp domain-containing protein [Oscillospiraceae bacterium]